ncbi:(deoxy)nucleoside triphosphate pyrophosphohydrolase [Novosphingobium aquiterrae]|uniref:8-oxo-dGTP diphosphatase n=1 Tax=Novosphingobium aquiterrae TaxID=624388 RepID=A0ABV6PGN6_9SPHN
MAVALINDGGEVLMQRRPPDKAHGGLWEFPGGKVETAETLVSALLREIEEELGIGLDPDALEPLSFAARPEQPHVVLLYICREWHGVPTAIEASAIGWFSLDELAALSMPPLDQPLACALHRSLKR